MQTVNSVRPKLKKQHRNVILILLCLENVLRFHSFRPEKASFAIAKQYGTYNSVC